MADGPPIDPEGVCAVAVSDNSVDPEYCLTCEETGLSVFDVVSDAVATAGTIAPEGGRFVVVRS